MSDSRTAVDSPEVWTVARILDWTTRYLKQHGSDTPRLDTEILLAHTRKCARIQLYTNFDSPLTEDERAEMRDLVKRRAQAEPVAYLVGHREFFGLDFKVTKAVLIPRPDTETLVVELIERAKEAEQPRILDVCTGSGCIAIAAADNLPTAQFVASDLSPAALAIARENAAAHKLGERIEFREGNLLTVLRPDEVFDMIVSNPPYIPDGEIAELDPDVRNHEPLQALQGGADGMLYLKQIVADAPQHLKVDGWLLVETGIEQAPLTAAEMERNPAFSDVKVMKDLGGRPRVVMGRRVASGE